MSYVSSASLQQQVEPILPGWAAAGPRLQQPPEVTHLKGTLATIFHPKGPTSAARRSGGNGSDRNGEARESDERIVRLHSVPSAKPITPRAKPLMWPVARSSRADGPEGQPGATDPVMAVCERLATGSTPSESTIGSISRGCSAAHHRSDYCRARRRPKAWGGRLRRDDHDRVDRISTSTGTGAGMVHVVPNPGLRGIDVM
jgi:hypothetical protein